MPSTFLISINIRLQMLLVPQRPKTKVLILGDSYCFSDNDKIKYGDGIFSGLITGLKSAAKVAMPALKTIGRTAVKVAKNKQFQNLVKEGIKAAPDIARTIVESKKQQSAQELLNKYFEALD